MNSNKVKVLHIITNLPVGGAQDNTLLTVEKLDRRKYDVSLLCANEGEWTYRAQRIEGLKLFFVDELKRKIHPVLDILSFWKILRIIKSENFDIVHTHSSKPGGLGRVAAKLAGVPIIIHTIHGFPFNDFMHPIVRHLFIVAERFLSRLSDSLVTVSTYNLKKAVQLKFAPRSKFRNIYSGIDFGRFEVTLGLEQIRNELGISNGEKVVGMIGRLSEQKAPLDFVNAMPKILQAHHDVRFLLIGDGELKEQTLDLARKLKVDSKIQILGFRDDVPELLHLLDIFVLTSLWEGLGRSLTEAMFMGKPVVATNVEGVPELVKNNETGFLVEPRNIDSISEAVISLLSDSNTAQRLGRNAAKRINSEFQADSMVARIDNLYQELLIPHETNSEPSKTF